MEIYERIRDLRKNYLRLSQEAFGKRLGVSRSVINNIERNALARPDQKLSLIKLICKEFSINEDWLLNGNEPMLVQPDTFSLDDFMKQHNATDLELQIVKTYFELEPDTREMLIEHFRSKLSSPVPAAAPQDKKKTKEELEDEYKKVLNSASKKNATASSTTDDTDIKASNE